MPPDPLAAAGPRQLRRLLAAVLSVSTDLDVERTLRRIVEEATSLVGARYGALGVVDETGTRLSQLITVGVDDVTRAAIGGLLGGLGLFGVGVDEQRPVRLRQITEHARRGPPAEDPRLRSFLAVPVRVGSEVFGSLYLAEKVGGDAFDEVDEGLAATLAVAAGVAVEHARLFRQAQHRGAALAALQEVAASLAAEDSGPDVLQLVGDRALELVGADLATIAVLADDEGQLVIEVAVGPLSGDLAGEMFARDGSISGEVVRTGRPVTVTDVTTDPRAVQPQVRIPGLGPAVWVALPVEGDRFGSLGVARRAGAPPFTDAEVELVTTFAASAGVAVAQERSRRQRTRLRVLEDQERVARNLHGTVIQQLFATALGLQGLAGGMEGSARRRLEGAVEDLDRVVRTIRTVVFDLQSADDPADEGPRRRVLDVVHELAPLLGAEPAVAFAGPIDVEVGPALAQDLLAVVREALTNVARHARATRVELELSCGDGCVRVRVRDNGVGFDRPAGAGPGFGLGDLEERARRLGGTFSLGRRSGGGTDLRWQVPLAPD